MLKLTDTKKDESTRLHIYRTIKESIIEFYLKPGDLINETVVANELQVSRTPVREAFILLEQEKLIEVKTKKGTYVSLISLKDIETFVFIRRLVERDIVKEICQSRSEEDLQVLNSLLEAQKIIVDCDNAESLFFILDNEFHRTIYKSVGKEDVWQSIIHFESAFNRLRKLDSMERSHVKKRYEEHVELVRLVANQDVDAAEKLISKHLNALDEALPYLIERYPDYFKN